MSTVTTDPSTAQANVPARPLTFPTIAIVNDPSSGVLDADVARIVGALATQLSLDFGPAWATGAHLRFVPTAHRPPPGVWVIVLLDNSDLAGALGYHDLTPDGKPLGKVFAGTDRQYGASLSVTLSHELLEMLADPYINTCVQAATGIFYALEVSDAVEADELGYEIAGVRVSNFVLPAWFGNARGPVDHLGRIHDPFELAPGGYISAFDPSSGQGWVQLTDSRFAGSDLDRWLARPRVGSRRERRFIPRHLWVPSTYLTDTSAPDGPDSLS